jgi:hypothetical protein
MNQRAEKLLENAFRKNIPRHKRTKQFKNSNHEEVGKY